MNKKLTMLTIIIMIMFPLSVGPGLAATVDHGVGKYEITDFPVLNQCTGEWFQVSGTIHYNWQTVTDSAGGVHWRIHANHNLRGFSADGTKYQVISTETQHFNTKAGAAYEWTYMNTSPLISQGEETNMLFKIRNHVTVNASGDITVSFSEIEIVCPG